MSRSPSSSGLSKGRRTDATSLFGGSANDFLRRFMDAFSGSERTRVFYNSFVLFLSFIFSIIAIARS